MTIKYEKRLCKVKDEYGYFHTWEQYSQPVDGSILTGVGHGYGTMISLMTGIVEFSDGSVKRVSIESIKFVDEINEELKFYNENPDYIWAKKRKKK